MGQTDAAAAIGELVCEVAGAFVNTPTAGFDRPNRFDGHDVESTSAAVSGPRTDSHITDGGAGF
jgi:hypothetical protein